MKLFQQFRSSASPAARSRLSFSLVLMILAACPAFSQTAYFVDGYHGGVWGHYPPWVTQFMVDQLKLHPDWKINLEIEPES